MGVKVKLSENFKAIEKRLKKLPELYGTVMYTFAKTDAVSFIKLFQKHIENNDLFVEALKPRTIRAKELKGYDKPSNPLYGEGYGEDESYINMFSLRKIKDGWKCYPRWAKHHESALQLRDLLNVHEFGATINNNGTLIRIPPRPVVFLTYRDVMNTKKKKDNSQKVKRAINQYINTGNQVLMDKIASKEKTIGKEFTSQ